MNQHYRDLACYFLILTAFLTLAPAIGRAELVPPGDFLGKSHDEWGLAWTQWGLRIGSGGETLPNTADGVRYLPFAVGTVFEADVTIEEGTPVLFLPFVLFGEQYADGSEDDPVALADFINNDILGPTTIQTTIDGDVVLDGDYFDFSERIFDITFFPQPIEYAAPNPRFPAVSAYWATGITAIFDGLTPGEHTIVNVQNTPFFGGLFTATYNVTVVPEPSGLSVLGLGGVALVAARRLTRAPRRCA